MDKFGIFNILSSLIGKNGGILGGEKGNANANFSTELGDGKKLNGNNNDSVAEKRAGFAPLNSAMLSTMKNHEEFINRVKIRNGKK